MNLYGESLQNVPFIHPKESGMEMALGRLKDHVNEKQTQKKIKFCQTRTKTFYRKFNQFIWKFVCKVSLEFCPTNFSLGSRRKSCVRSELDVMCASISSSSSLSLLFFAS